LDSRASAGLEQIDRAEKITARIPEGIGHGRAVSNDPVELGREPARTARLPDRDHLSADTEHVAVGIERHQRSKPAVRCDGLIVEERDDFSRGRGNTGVAHSNGARFAGVIFRAKRLRASIGRKQSCRPR
jgi:hypothetical protein